MDNLCQQCGGACCTSLLMPAPTPDDMEFLAGRALVPMRGAVLLNCRCSFLEEGRCSIHDHKPKFCVEFEAGGADCRRTVKLLRPELAKEWGWL